MSRDEIHEHAGYVGDEVKVAAYRRALAEVISPESVVLDLGSGSGLLGLLAAEAGAAKVHIVEEGDIIGVAREVAEVNGLADRMVFHQAYSTDLELADKADVLVCDQIGGLAYDAGVLEYSADARARLLAPDAILIPGSFRLLAAPISWPGHGPTVEMWRHRPGGFDFGPMARLAANTEYRDTLPPECYLGSPVEWATVAADHNERFGGTARLAVSAGGVLNAVAGLFVASLSPSVELTNCSLLDGFFDRWSNIYPLAEPIEVRPGDEVEVTFDIRPAAYIANWKVSVTAAGETRMARHSTVQGMFLAPGSFPMPTTAANARPADGRTAPR